jgi:hypothetical protein
LIEVEFSMLAIRTSTGKQAVAGGVPAASRAVVTGSTKQNLVPAVFAQIFVGFTNTLAAVDTDRRPKEMVQTLHEKRENLSQSRRIHACII